ncbi:MAG TPA: glycoside hydrolase family 75 protein [Rugosimonospora sp.]
MRLRRVLLAGAGALATVGINVATIGVANAATYLYEAESPANTLSGAATLAPCGMCLGGSMVGFAGDAAGSLQFNGVAASATGGATVTISYTAATARQAQLSVNGGAPTTLSFVATGGDAVVSTLVATANLNAGNNTLTFTNAGGVAPDFDAITVSSGATRAGAGADGLGGGNGVASVGTGTGTGAGAGAGVGVAAASGTAGGAGGPTAAQLLARTASCSPVSNGTYRSEGDSNSVPVCGATGAVFWKSGMAIDCDGQRSDQCNESTDCCFADQTAFQQSDGRQLDSATLPYIVVPGSSGTWNYASSGIQAGSVAAVIYNDRVVYAVVGDVGPTQMIGEGSYALALGLGINPNARIGGAGSGVTFIVFTGPAAVVQPIESNAAAVALGERLAQQFVSGN